MMKPAMRALHSNGKYRRSLISALIAGVIIAASAPVGAQGVAPASQQTDTALARQIRAMEDITLAHRLAVYGQRARQPLALVTAAEILLANPTRPLAPPPADSAGTDVVTPDPRRLLATARRLAAGSDRLLDIIGPAEQRARAVDRGSAKGPRQLYGQVTSAAKREHMIEFRGGEPAVVYVSGDGDSDLDLFVYDAANNLVASATGPRDECVVRWQPDRQGQFRIEVRNIGEASNWYWMVTN